MLACVCQPTETALLFKGGPPVTMGPLGTSNKARNTDVMKTIKVITKTGRRPSADTDESSPTLTSIPTIIDSSGTLLNLRMIERKAKSTKILVNPVCSDSISASDDSSHNSQSGRTKWNGKKQRLKIEREKPAKIVDKNDYEQCRDGAKEDKKSVSCFKIKSWEDRSRMNDDKKLGRENCSNENASNSMDISKPDLINHSKKSTKETLVDEGTMTDVMLLKFDPKNLTEGAVATDELGEGVELTLGELRAMALRQQQQIDTQHQLLCAKEQRLRYLKQQEARHHQVAVEGERLRRLRERVEAQELKLRRLRALRGQLDRNKQANVALTSDLESIRALFNEKEKELSVAVAKVEELTRQLEELRRGRAPPAAPAPAAPAAPPAPHELDKLRRELMYRNKLNEQQNGRLSAQRAALGARQEEMRSIDRRVAELQARLLRKRALNRQLAAAHRLPHAPPAAAAGRTSNPTPMQQLPSYPPTSIGSTQPKNQQSRGNVAAVEPYNHVPHAQSLSHSTNFQAMKQNAIQNNVPLKQLTQTDNMQSHLTQQEAHYLQQKQMMNPLYNGSFPHHEQYQYSGHVQQGIAAYDQKPMLDHLNKYSEYSKQPQYSPNSTSSSNSNQTGKDVKINEQEFPPEFAASKSDPKYQTLPYNTKFPPANGKLKQPEVNGKVPDPQDPKGQSQQNAPNINHMTVHSTPLSVVNKSLATPLSQNEAAYQQEHTYQLQKSDSSSRCNQEGKENQAYPQNSRISQSNCQNGDGSKPGGKSQQSAAPKGTSPSVTTGAATTGSSIGFGTPPRQCGGADADSPGGAPEPAADAEPASQREAGGGGEMIIKPRPLTIRKPPPSERPKLRNGVGTNRRIEMPPAFLFPEMDRLSLDCGDRGDETGSPSSGGREDGREPAPERAASPAPDERAGQDVPRRSRKGNLKQGGKAPPARRVSFDPLALLLDASLEGELDLVKKTATQVQNASAANDEGITALHNAICAGHFDIVKFLVELGCDVNAQDSDGWTPLHCAASCNNLPMVRFLVDNGACIFATTLSDHETAAEKCEEDEEGFDGCSEYLYSVQEKLGIANGGRVFAVFAYGAARPDELSFAAGDALTVLRKTDDGEREWWWSRDGAGREGYVPRNLLGLYPRVTPPQE